MCLATIDKPTITILLLYFFSCSRGKRQKCWSWAARQNRLDDSPWVNFTLSILLWWMIHLYVWSEFTSIHFDERSVEFIDIFSLVKRSVKFIEIFYHKECIVLPARKGEISSWAPAKALKCRYLLKLNRVKESRKVNESESKVSELSGNQ